MNPHGSTTHPRPPRIAFINQDLWVGGGTVFLINLVGELVRRGIPAHVFCLANIHSLAADFEQQHIPVSFEEVHGTIFEDRVLGVLGKMAHFAPGIVVSNVTPGPCEVMRYLPARVHRVGVVHTLSQVETAVQYVSAFDRLVAVSTHLRDLLIARREFEGSRVDSIELGVPIPGSVHRDDLVSDRPLRILYLGRLEDPAKRVRLFPAILERLKASQIPFVWTIAGAGPEEGYLRSQLVTQDPAQRVHFAGLVRYSDVPALLSGHDILLLTSDTEAFPLSLHEGMAAGLVPVVSDVPGRIREIVTAETGILVPPSNIPGYADAIVWLHEHRDEMHRMSVEARALIGGQYSVGAMTDRWLALLPISHPDPPILPDRWELLPPLFPHRSLWFSRPGRWARRVAARVRSHFIHPATAVCPHAQTQGTETRKPI
jgi:glycosyltransferase involved in cell wall biosynthesis